MEKVKIISDNRKARHDYTILDTLEAGLVLVGSEVKALRSNQVTLKDSYISFVGQEAFLQNAHINIYTASSYNNHEPERLRKLLLHKKELERLQADLREKGLACVPLKLYFKKGRVKVLLGLGKGKNRGDKREDLKKRDATRQMDRATRRSKP